MPYCYGCMKEVNTEGKCPYCGFDINEYEVQPHHLKLGTILRNRFVVGKVIGEGGFGITYVGIDNVLRLKVAIKEFYMSGFVNRNNTISSNVSYETGSKKDLFEKNREKFIQEARTLALFINTDGIVDVRDFFNENNTSYIVMDFVEGESLRSYLQKKNRLSVDETLFTMMPIINALKKVHAKNVIHRDISPDNILLSNDGKVYLVDFGAAREVAEGDLKSLSVILKPGYAPNEQYRTKGVQGPWTDIYALSATMYRCISGVRPEEALERIIKDDVQELSVVAPDCPAEISNVIMKGLAIYQENRYQNLEDMDYDFQTALASLQEKETISEYANGSQNVFYANNESEQFDNTVDNDETEVLINDESVFLTEGETEVLLYDETSISSCEDNKKEAYPNDENKVDSASSPGIFHGGITKVSDDSNMSFEQKTQPSMSAGTSEFLKKLDQDYKDRKQAELASIIGLASFALSVLLTIVMFFSPALFLNLRGLYIALAFLGLIAAVVSVILFARIKDNANRNLYINFIAIIGVLIHLSLALAAIYKNILPFYN